MRSGTGVALHREVATRLTQLCLVAVGVVLLGAGSSARQTVPVRYPEGLVHGFLTLRTLDGNLLADGDLIQNVRGDRVTARLVFRFEDGSLHDETSIYSQRQHFQLISNRLIQKGPAFPRPLEASIDVAKGLATVKYADDGKEKIETEQLDLPPNLANGLVSTMLKNVRPNALPEPLALVAATPKPRLVKLAISVAGIEPFSTEGTRRRARHYVIKVKIGGIAGLLAPLVGKQPPDSHVWILGGDAPAFVRAEQPLFAGGPLWRIELTSPKWSMAETDAPAAERRPGLEGRRTDPGLPLH